MLNRLFPERRHYFNLIVFLFLGAAWIYSFLEKNYFPADTECSLYNQVSGESCLFAIGKDGFPGAFFTADSESIIYADNDILRIEPIGLMQSLGAGHEFKLPYRIESLTVSSSRNMAVVCFSDWDTRISEFWILDIQGKAFLKKVQQTLENGCPPLIEFSLDESVLGYSTGWPQNINLLNWQTGEVQSVVGGDVTFSPKGDLLAIHDGEFVKLLSYPSLEEAHVIENVNYVRDFTFSADGTLIAIHSLFEVNTFDVTSGALIDKQEQVDGQQCNLKFAALNTLVTCLNVQGEVFIVYWYFYELGTPDQDIFYSSIMKVGSRDVNFIDISDDNIRILVSYEDHIGVFVYPEMYR